MNSSIGFKIDYIKSKGYDTIRKVPIEELPENQILAIFLRLRNQDNEVKRKDKKKNMFYIPEGFAHGYITLTDDTEISYLVSAPYTPGQEAGIRYDDPQVAVQWPIEPQIISDKDKNWPYLKN